MDIADFILYEDTEVLVCHKHAGTAVQTKRIGEQDMESLLRNYLAGKGQGAYIGIVHRLDQPVEGVMVFAKTPVCAAALNRQMQKGLFGKYYLAVLSGQLKHKTGTLTDYLRKDGKKNISVVVSQKDPESKKAVLHYRILEELEEESLVEVQLETGRHHQIRVQMAHAGCPLAGDGKYALLLQNESEKGTIRSFQNRDTGIALCSYRMEFRHPVNGKMMQFQIRPEGDIFHKFASLKSLYE